MGSRDLCNDLDVVPIKGQVIKVQAPWIKHFTAVNDSVSPLYIIPRLVFRYNQDDFLGWGVGGKLAAL